MSQPLTIALAGHANVGKTSLVSALTRDATLAVAEESGTTRSHYVKTYSIAGQDVLAFVDTPGFEFASRINRWLDAHGGEGSDRLDGRSTLAAFLEDTATNSRHDKEKEALRGALKADVIAYVADVTHVPEGQVVQEVRLLRRAGVPMVGVLNNLHSDGALPTGWIEMLRGEGVDAIVQLDALRFPAEQERSFYDALAVLRPEHKAAFAEIEQLRGRLEEQNLVRAAVAIAEMLVDTISFQHRSTYASEEEAKRHRSAANNRFKEMLRDRERAGFQEIARIYGFDLDDFGGDSLDVQSSSGALSDDLFDAEALQRYGLSTLTLAAVGGATGTALDALSGGLTFGVPTLLGTLTGAAAGLWWGRKVSTRIEAGTLTVGPVDSMQFPAMLLHRAVDCWRQVARRSHADRGQVQVVSGEREGLDTLGAQALIRIARKCSKHPEWSRIGGRVPAAGRGPTVDALTERAEKLLRRQLSQLDGR